MKKINPDKMTKTQLDLLGAAAEKTTYHNTSRLTAQAREALAKAARKGGRPRIGAARSESTSPSSFLC